MTKTNNKVRMAILPLLLLGVALAAQPAAAADDCEVRIGVAGPLSGGASAFGLSNKAPADYQAKLANDAGGLEMGGRKCRVKVFYFDSQYTAAGGAAAANYMASEDVHVLMGPAGAPEVTGFLPVAKRTGIINFSTTYMATAISPEYPYAFHSLQAPVTWGPLVVKQVAQKFGIDRVIIVGANDQGGTDGSEQLVKLYAAAGVKATTEYFQRGTTNFAPVAARLVAANPTAVDVATMPPADASLLVRQLLDVGYNGVIGALGGVGIGPLSQGAGGVQNIKKMYWLETMPTDDPRVVKMKQDYEKLMGAAPPSNPNFAVQMVAAEQVFRAIKIAGTSKDVDKIADALRKMTPESVWLGKGGWRGRTIYGINQELAFPVGLGYVVDGKNLGVQAVDIPSEP